MTNKIDQLELALEVEREKFLHENKKKLFEASERNDLATIKLLVEKHKYLPLKSTNKELRTVAQLAALKGYFDIVKYVADTQPFILSNRDRYGDTILHLPDEKFVMEIIKYLEEKYKDDIPKWPRSDFERMAIHGAAKQGHRETLAHFLEKKNGDVNAPNDRQQPPIFTAVEYHRTEVFKYLVEDRKANLTALDENDDNILFVAVTADDLPTMKYVLDERKANIDINWQNKWKHNLVHRSTMLNRLGILQYIVEEKHADVNVQGHEKRTALDHACSKNYYEACKFLVEHGANTQFRDQFGYYAWQKPFNKTLVDYMRNVSLKNNWTELARRRRNVDFQPVQLLQDYSLNSDESKAIDNSHLTQPQYLLQLLQLALGYVSARSPAPDVSIQHERMDPMAIDAVDALPDLWDE